MTRRGTTNRNARGSSYDRARRRRFLLAKFGDGTTAQCALRTSSRCLGALTFETVTADRIVPGAEGGTYSRDNIQPACGPCQSEQGARLAHSRRELASA
jgi:hypothetical protein